MTNNNNRRNDSGMNQDKTSDFEMERENEGQKGGATAWDSTDTEKSELDDMGYEIGESDYSGTEDTL